MILHRLGSKKYLARILLQYFPKHDIYIEPFFGAGSVFFAKEKVLYNIVNDIDEDVYNLFRQIVENKDELIYWLKMMLITEKQLKRWYSGEREKSDVLNAVRFLVISNWSIFGNGGGGLCSWVGNGKQIILQGIEKTFEMLNDVLFFNCDFREFFKKITFRGDAERQRTFCYCDPPYLNRLHMYSKGFSEEDFFDLLNCLEEAKFRFAISETDNSFVIEEARRRGLNVIFLKNINYKKRHRREILIMNYETNLQKLFI